MKQLLLNAQITNEGKTFFGSVLIDAERIAAVYPGIMPLTQIPEEARNAQIENCEGLWLFPGVIDDQVHFRDPGLTHKGDIESESRAAIAGGVTSFMDMPNTNPATTSYDALMWKRDHAHEVSWANYAFFVGGTNSNADSLFSLDPKIIPGIKLFLGASTGNMLVDRREAVEIFFAESPHLIAIHSESEEIIRRNRALYIERYGEDPPITCHPLIRSDEACYRCTSEAIDRATKYGTRLHVLHLSTAREVALFRHDLPLKEKLITSEVCVHHLWFTDQDYARLGTRIKWNPAIKTEADRQALRQGLIDGALDIVATDHAPHLWQEKEGGALKAASGGPLVQYSLLVMLQLAEQGLWSRELVVDKMCHRPSDLFSVQERGYIRPGYYADLVLINPRENTEVNKESIVSRCGWSPFEGYSFDHSIESTYVNGQRAYYKGMFEARPSVKPLLFNR